MRKYDTIETFFLDKMQKLEEENAELRDKIIELEAVEEAESDLPLFSTVTHVVEPMSFFEISNSYSIERGFKDELTIELVDELLNDRDKLKEFASRSNKDNWGSREVIHKNKRNGDFVFEYGGAKLVVVVRGTGNGEIKLDAHEYDTGAPTLLFPESKSDEMYSKALDKLEVVLGEVKNSLLREAEKE